MTSARRAFAASGGHPTCVLSMMLFAAGFPAVGVLLETWGPMAIVAVRIVLACAFMLILWLAIEGVDAVVRAPWKRGLWIGALGFGAGTTALVYTQDLTDAVTAALVTASMPVSAVALEVLLDGRKLTRNFVFGLILVLCGGIMATGADLTEARFGLGAVIGLVATVIFSWGSRATVHGLPATSGLGRSAITMIGAMFFCLIGLGGALALGLPGTHIGVVDARIAGLMALYAIGAMAISQILWILGVGRVGIGLASFHLNAVPFYVMLIYLAFGGSWVWDQAVGAGILAIGVVLAQRRDTRATAPAD